MVANMELEEARKNIDKIDNEMRMLFIKRLEEVNKVIRYKKEHNLPVPDSFPNPGSRLQHPPGLPLPASISVPVQSCCYPHPFHLFHIQYSEQLRAVHTF